jgi:hypothetical protein
MSSCDSKPRQCHVSIPHSRMAACLVGGGGGAYRAGGDGGVEGREGCGAGNLGVPPVELWRREQVREGGIGLQRMNRHGGRHA